MPEIRLPCYDIVVTLEPGSAGMGGIIHSKLHSASNPASFDEAADEEHFNAAMDGIESMILAHACAGIDIAAPQYVEGIKTAVEAAAENI